MDRFKQECNLCESITHVKVIEDNILTDSSIKTEEIEIKSEPIDDEMIFEIPCDIKKEPNEEGDTPSHSQNGWVDSKGLYDPDDLKPTSLATTSSNRESEESIYESATGIDGDNRNTKRGEKQPEPLTKRSKVKENKSGNREYKTRDTAQFKQRLSLRKDPEAKTFECDVCQYVTRHRNNFTRHCLKHKDPCDVKMYECEECDYKSLQKVQLQRHQLKHKNASEVQKYGCDVCDYKSVRKGDLKTHQLRHKDPTETKLYKCDQCQYATRYRNNFTRHCLQHKDPCDVKMYACDRCRFLTKHKRNLRLHHVTHTDPAEVQKYRCEVCGFEAKFKRYLTKHQSKHRDPEGVPVYQCDDCGYETKVKGYLKRHQAKHRSFEGADV